MISQYKLRKWSKDFNDADKKRPADDTACADNSDYANDLKEVAA